MLLFRARPNHFLAPSNRLEIVISDLPTLIDSGFLQLIAVFFMACLIASFFLSLEAALVVWIIVILSLFVVAQHFLAT